MNSRNTKENKRAGGSRTFWAILLGLLFATILIWGIYELVDDDYEEIDINAGEIGWVDDREGDGVVEEEAAGEREYGGLDRPVD